MKPTVLVATCAAIAIFACASVAGAQTDCAKLVPASPWGPNDQTGATNRVTPAVTKAAAAEIQSGEVVVMSYPLTDGVPLFGSRFTKTILTAVSLAPGAAFGENELTYMEDTWLSQSHVGTHLDGMGHIGRKDCYYNRTPMGKFINQNNMTKLGLEHLKSFATRGVLVDMVKVFQAAGKLKTNPACKKPCLDKGTLITAADIQAGLRMYNVTLREGDIVIIHTGWGDLFEQFPAQNALYNSGEPGIGKDAANWLVSQKVVAVGSDSWAVEVIPGENPKEAFIVHNILLTDSGIHIIENVRTDLMAAAAAASGRATFFFSMTVPKAVGLTGNFVAIEGIR
jgi:kynurenine formamidase